MPTVNEKKVSDLIGLAYESSLDPTEEGWKSFYSEFAETVACGGGAIAIFDKSTNVYREIARSHDPEIVERLNEVYYSQVPFREELENLAPGELFDRRLRFPDEIYLNSGIYVDFFSRYAIPQFIHQKIYDDDRFSLAIGLNWPKERADLDSEAHAMMEEVFPHLRRAMDLYLNQLRNGSENGLLKRAIAEIDPGVLILNKSGKVLFENERAERLLAEKAGIARDRGGELAMRSPARSRKLKSRIGRIASADPDDQAAASETFILTGSDGLASLEVKLTRIEPGHVLGIGDDACVMMTVRPLLNVGTPPVKDLRRLYGLTPAEERLARMIADGHSVQEACAMLNISANTARTHLKRIFSKTDTHRQSSLVKLILS
ncbi:MAG: helix-turn-helix transcriptional regulator [Pyrinomonadaceae bacterium]